jgi:hypothetical protein
LEHRVDRTGHGDGLIKVVSPARKSQGPSGAGPAIERPRQGRSHDQASSTCVLLADSTKYGTFSKFQVTELDKLDAIISDDELSPDTRIRVEELGVEMITVSVPAA